MRQTSDHAKRVQNTYVTESVNWVCKCLHCYSVHPKGEATGWFKEPRNEVSVIVLLTKYQIIKKDEIVVT